MFVGGGEEVERVTQIGTKGTRIEIREHKLESKEHQTTVKLAH